MHNRPRPRGRGRTRFATPWESVGLTLFEGGGRMAGLSHAVVLFEKQHATRTGFAGGTDGKSDVGGDLGGGFGLERGDAGLAGGCGDSGAECVDESADCVFSTGFADDFESGGAASGFGAAAACALSL